MANYTHCGGGITHPNPSLEGIFCSYNFVCQWNKLYAKKMTEKDSFLQGKPNMDFLVSDLL
jgi:hypothetical protein